MKLLTIELEDYDDEPSNTVARAAAMAMFSAFEVPVTVTCGDTKLRMTSYAQRDIADILESVVKAAGLTKYVRTNGGKTVHLAECPTAMRAKSTVQWQWAEQFTNGRDLESALNNGGDESNKYGIRGCVRCDPFGWQDLNA